MPAQAVAERARVEPRVGVGPAQGRERDDWPVADAGREQPVELGEPGADVFGHGCRFGLAVLDIQFPPFPFIGSGLPLPDRPAGYQVVEPGRQVGLEAVHDRLAIGAELEH